jgi:hypothetical protein
MPLVPTWRSALLKPGEEQHAVQVRLERGVRGAAVQHDAVGVAEDHAHWFGRELVGDIAQHRLRHPGGQAFEVVGVRQLDVVGRNAPRE